MAVAFRSSSIRGSGDQLTTSCAIPVPSGAVSGDIVVCGVGRWLGDLAGGAITPPTGFTLIAAPLLVNTEIHVYWKRLTGSDTGNYTFTWTGSEWNNGNAVCTTGGLSSGDPIEDFATGTADSTSYPSLTVSTVTEPFLAWVTYNESADATTDAPDNFTGIQAQDYGFTAWRVPGATGSHTATGATAGSSMELAAVLVAIKPESVAAVPPWPRRRGPNYRR